jgi:hypothetical protein
MVKEKLGLGLDNMVKRTPYHPEVEEELDEFRSNLDTEMGLILTFKKKLT